MEFPGVEDDQADGFQACDACQELQVAAEVARLACGHSYCGECLNEIYRNATVEEESFPPRCCGVPMDLEEVRSLLDPGVLENFEAKVPEFSSTNRTYCSDPECAAFVPPENIIGNIATCPNCESKTCTMCKQSEHTGQDCHPDEHDDAYQQTLQLAMEEGWQQCRRCRRMVELTAGCNHITCICGYEFCYVCGAEWRTCGCL